MVVFSRCVTVLFLPYSAVQADCVRPQSLSHVRVCNRKDCSPPGSSVHWIFQARILEWIAISSSGRSPQPRDGTCDSCVLCVWWVCCFAGKYFTAEPSEKRSLADFRHVNLTSVPQQNQTRIWNIHPAPRSAMQPKGTAPDASGPQEGRAAKQQGPACFVLEGPPRGRVSSGPLSRCSNFWDYKCHVACLIGFQKGFLAEKYGNYCGRSTTKTNQFIGSGFRRNTRWN